MKIANEIKKLVEANEASGLSDMELKKFWKQMQDHVFKQSPEVIKNDMGLFFDGTEIKFSGVPYDEDNTFGEDFRKNPQDYVQTLELKSLALKDLTSQILNEYVLDRESTEEEDSQAVQYLLKNLKNETVFFYAKEEIEMSNPKGRDVAVDVKYEGTAKIKNFKYNEKDDELTVSDHDIIKFEVEVA